MDILTTLVVGLVVGALAKLVMPGKDPGGFIITILLGIAGAFVAGWLGQALGWYKAGESPGIISATFRFMRVRSRSNASIKRLGIKVPLTFRRQSYRARGNSVASIFHSSVS